MGRKIAAKTTPRPLIQAGEFLNPPAVTQAGIKKPRSRAGKKMVNNVIFEAPVVKYSKKEAAFYAADALVNALNDVVRAENRALPVLELWKKIGDTAVKLYNGKKLASPPSAPKDIAQFWQDVSAVEVVAKIIGAPRDADHIQRWGLMCHTEGLGKKYWN